MLTDRFTEQIIKGITSMTGVTDQEEDTKCDKDQKDRRKKQISGEDIDVVWG